MRERQWVAVVHCCWQRQRWRQLLLGCVGAVGGWLQARPSSLILRSAVPAFLLCSQGAARYENGGVYVGEFANDVRSGWGEPLVADIAQLVMGASSRLASACRSSRAALLAGCFLLSRLEQACRTP